MLSVELVANETLFRQSTSSVGPEKENKRNINCKVNNFVRKLVRDVNFDLKVKESQKMALMHYRETKQDNFKKAEKFSK